MLKSHALVFSDFESSWYKHWTRKLKQTPAGKGKFALKANKFWQNAVITQALYERGALSKGRTGIGFGVGMERLPALFASMGVNVTATDQEFTKDQAKDWDNDQLAYGAQSLNTEGICPANLFKNNVSYRAVDMKKIPKDLAGSYDFLWSNCALGHLGSIEASLDFIQKSLDCLKPGGWAVSTTEVNFLSNTETLDQSSTVFFRQKDFLNLFTKLSRQGYIVNPLTFGLGESQEDKRFTLEPLWGNDYSKILFNGYMATQVVLIVHKPRRQLSHALRSFQVAKHKQQYVRNLLKMRKHIRKNKALAQAIAANLAAKSLTAADTAVRKQKQQLKVRLKRGESKAVQLGYTNASQAGLFKIHHCFEGTNPVTVATAHPINRVSQFRDMNWYEPNRPGLRYLETASNFTNPLEVEYVRPMRSFFAEINVSAKNVKPGHYEEWFCLVKERDDMIPDTEVKLLVEVV
ncbi:MAG: class I SAM-dependent methyltransferase [Patescibacteria group bacterium]